MFTHITHTKLNSTNDPCHSLQIYNVKYFKFSNAALYYFIADCIAIMCRLNAKYSVVKMLKA
jgi:hypothetical protein